MRQGEGRWDTNSIQALHRLCIGVTTSDHSGMIMQQVFSLITKQEIFVEKGTTASQSQSNICAAPAVFSMRRASEPATPATWLH